MLDARDLVADGRVDSEFFLQLPAQGVARLLAFLDFSSGELPFERHGLMAGTLAHQHLPVLRDEACDYALHSSCSARLGFSIRMAPTSGFEPLLAGAAGFRGTRFRGTGAFHLVAHQNGAVLHQS